VPPSQCFWSHQQRPFVTRVQPESSSNKANRMICTNRPRVRSADSFIEPKSVSYIQFKTRRHDSNVTLRLPVHRMTSTPDPKRPRWWARLYFQWVPGLARWKTTRELEPKSVTHTILSDLFQIWKVCVITDRVIIVIPSCPLLSIFQFYLT
jgi:hypothetical protein